MNAHARVILRHICIAYNCFAELTMSENMDVVKPEVDESDDDIFDLDTDGIVMDWSGKPVSGIGIDAPLPRTLEVP